MVQQDRLLQTDDILKGSRSDYKIINLIGRGGMAAVYRALRLADNTVWALKEMRPPPDTPPNELEENRKLFDQEAELLGTLSYPNLPVIADHFVYNGRPVLVMEFIPGQTLEDVMRDANAPLLEQQVVGYGIQLCRVLQYLHTHNPPIIFRDLKPSNIMRTPEGVMKLIDFGVARTYKVNRRKDTIAMGSAGYAPPEQYGTKQTDARSDIYALGATLLHVLTNLPPVPLQTPAPGSIRRQNPSVDTQTEEVIIKAMALDREQRFASCAEMEGALMRCLDGPYVDPTVLAAPPPPAAPVPLPTADVTIATERVLSNAPTVSAAARPTASVPTQTAPAVMSAPIAASQLAPDGITCARCGRVNKKGARFCAACGAPLAGLPVPRLMINSPRGSLELKLERMPSRIGRRDPRQNHYPEVDLAEYDRGIASRHHATIARDGDHYTITDLGSTNGTMLNGVLLPPRKPQPLRQGDRIKVGEVEMEFRWS